jgi:hypothetical protein
MRILINPNGRYMGQIVCFLIVNGGSRAGRLPGTPLWGKRRGVRTHTETRGHCASHDAVRSPFRRGPPECDQHVDFWGFRFCDERNIPFASVLLDTFLNTLEHCRLDLVGGYVALSDETVIPSAVLPDG